MQIPAHIAASTRKFLRHLAKSYVLDRHHEEILILLGEARDRTEQARQVLETQGITQVDARGIVRPHPCVAIERDSRIAVARLLRELALPDDGAADGENRPPRLRNRYTHRD